MLSCKLPHITQSVRM